MPRPGLSPEYVADIRRLADAGFAAKEIARTLCVSEATVSKYRGRKGLTMERRFEEKFSPEPNSGCWLWFGATTTSGRPYFSFKGKGVPASRAAWLIYRGDIPDGLFVLHNCHNQSCVNPRHLRLGTAQDNVDDMIGAGRAADKGDRSRAAAIWRAKRSGKKQREVAAEFGVRQSMVSRIWNGVRWPEIGST